MAALSKRQDLQYMLGLHETVAVAMADGYARATGRPALVNVHIAVGLANALSQIYNARAHRSPIVVTAGQAESHRLILEPSLSGPTAAMAAPFTKWAYELRQASDVPVALRRAFKVASDPPSGPVFLSLPIDLLEQEIDYPYGGSPINVRSRCRPDGSAVAAAASKLRQARRPVILCGDDVGHSAAVAEVVDLAEALGAEVFALNQCEISFPNDHPQFVRTLNVNSSQTREVLHGADVVVAIGTPLFSQVLDPGAELLSPDAAVIHLDEGYWETGKNIPTQVSLVGDIRLAAADLAAQIREQGDTETTDSVEERRTRLSAAKDAARTRLTERVAQARTTGPITSLRLMATIHDAVKDLSYVVVEEASTSAGALSQAFSFSRPGSLYSNRGGALGWAVPAALGVQLGRPTDTVIAVTGDGAINYSIQALWTAAHYRLPVKVVVCNNRSYKILRVNLSRFLPEEDVDSIVGMDLVDPAIDFAGLASGYGVPAHVVREPGDLDAAVGNWLAGPGPALLDVAVADD